MTDSANILSHLLNNPQTTVNKQWVLNLLQTHPCFYLPAALLLKRNPEEADRPTLQRLRSVVMMNCADRAAIIDYVDPYNAGWDSFYPKEEAKKSATDQTIDDFIEHFGQGSTPEEDAVLERLIFNPVPADYFGSTDAPIDPENPLALPPELKKDDAGDKSIKNDNHEESTATTQHDSRTDEPDALPESDASPLTPDERPHENTPGPAAGDSANEESLLTESLVKIFIKRHNYERALDIISRLSLNYPEKSVYFADQKRFLKKLIINQQYLNRQK